MASIRKEIAIDAGPEHVWAAMRDFGAVHRRVAPGFVTDLRLEEGARIVTFANGTVARELLVDLDDEARRLVYAVVGGQLTTHSASVQVLAEGDGRSRIVWVADLLPNELASYVSSQMDEAASVMRETLAREPAKPGAANRGA
ncbi:MAG: SRPBCC family protein [Hyphomicrobiales bacterium]